MKILVISRGSWSNDNNMGNTLSNLFSGFPDAEFQNIYFRAETPNNTVCSRHYSIDEPSLIMSVKNGRDVGRVVSCGAGESSTSAPEKKLYRMAARLNNSPVLFLLRECIWSWGRWRNDSLKNYIQDFDPDIIFMPVFYCYYPYKVLKYIRRFTSARLVLYHMDENYTLKQFSLSPFFWIYRFGLRHYIKDAVRSSDLNYAISEKQLAEYSNIFHKEFKLLYKSADFSSIIPPARQPNDPLKIVYTGNITCGRWKTLLAVGKELQAINTDRIRAQLFIYSRSNIKDKIRKSLDARPSSFFMGGVTPEETKQLQRDADIVIHCESFQFKQLLKVRLSFSTKIVDYFLNCKCIFAVGPKNVASIEYLAKNDAAVIAANPKEIKERLQFLIHDPKQIAEYELKSLDCGKRNHQDSVILQSFYHDFSVLCGAEEKKHNQPGT